jgi:Glycosyl transferase family 2
LSELHPFFAGVGAARNAALKSIDASSTYVALLDSDDCWHESHLEQGIRAFEAGNDFYFCDNYRAAYHDPYFAKNCPQILPFADSPGVNGAAEIPNEVPIGAILKGSATQADHASPLKSWSIAARA